MLRSGHGIIGYIARLRFGDDDISTHQVALTDW